MPKNACLRLCAPIALGAALGCSAAPVDGVSELALWDSGTKLVAFDAANYDQFGNSVAVSGDVAVVGAWQDNNEKGSDAGAAYVYGLNGSTWTLEQKLVASDGATLDRFGTDVSIEGDEIVVGAPYDDDHGDGSGSVYVFHFNGSSWVQQQKLLASDGTSNDWFGSAVEVSGDVMVIGAPGDNSNTGSAYVFRKAGGIWAEEDKLVASDGAGVDLFGGAVSISGSDAFIGASWNDDNGPDSGSAYVFSYNSVTDQWNQVQKLLASDAYQYDSFGSAVSIAGDVAIIGAPKNDDLGVDSGSAYVFRNLAGIWLEEEKLLASDGAQLDKFGYAVAISGSVAAVGAYQDDVNPPDTWDEGSAYVFGFAGSTLGWYQDTKLIASDFWFQEYFGNDVALDGDKIVVGCFKDGGSSAIGAAYVFEGAAGGSACSTNATCNDGNSCTTDTCLAGACVNTPVASGTPCPDDGNLCTNDSCNVTGTCLHPAKANGTACSDGLFCNGNDTCSYGVCLHFGSPCTANQSCNESTDQCVAGGAVCGDGVCVVGAETCVSCAADCRPDADLNLSCCVNSTDLAMLLGAWGPNSGNADLDGNGIVNASDLALLLAAWGCS